MMRRSPLVSADSHINEPPSLWKDRLGARFKPRAPRMERMELGDAWIFEGWSDPINFGNNISGGLPPEKASPWKRWEDTRPGGYDPKARLPEQDQDGVCAEVLYPTPRPSMAIFGNKRDPEFQVACMQAYNDWLSEYCSYNPQRLIGVAMMPTVGVDAAVAELRRALRLPGMKAALVGQYPSGKLAISPEDDAFWSAAGEMSVSVSIHVGLVDPGQDNDPNRSRPGARGELRHLDAPLRAYEFIHTGVFDRFPSLKLVLAEVDSSWIPYVKEQFDDRFKRLAAASRPPLKRLPSGYFDSNIFSTFITDKYGVINRRHIGVSQMMWSSDYPHGGTDWPNSWKTIDDHFAGVPGAEKHAILAGNATRLYNIAGVPDTMAA